MAQDSQLGRPESFAGLVDPVLLLYLHIMQCQIVDQAPETTVERIRVIVQVELEEYPEQVLDKQIVGSPAGR